MSLTAASRATVVPASEEHILFFLRKKTPPFSKVTTCVANLRVTNTTHGTLEAIWMRYFAFLSKFFRLVEPYTPNQQRA
jgi:hypothetical protein